MRIAFCLVLALLASGPALAQESNDALQALPLNKKLDLAKAGDEEASMAVAEAYEFGRDTKLDLATAARWYRDLALKGNLEAQYRLAKIVRSGSQGLRKDMGSAITLLTDAATKKHAASQFEMGVMYEAGLGVEKNDAKAVEWYGKAAEQNHAAAQRNLGLMILYGRGTKTDAKRAADLFEKSASANDGWAMNNLAALYEQGWGVKPDQSKARNLYVRAAALGITIAETNIKRLDQPKP